MAEIMIKVANLTKSYAGVPVVDDVSFEVRQGEIIGFLGPNGAGKTTTMRILTGFIPPSFGQVEISGMDVLTNSVEIRKKIGYLPENIPLYGEMRVTAYLNFIAQLKGLVHKEIVKEVERVVESCGLAEVRQKVIERLSKGYRQRVGLAQALVGEPEILILDEPTVGLDPKQIIEIRNLIKEIGKKRTVILSTHILPEVSQICNRILIINKGKLVATGTAEELQAKIKQNEIISVKVQGENQTKFKEFLKGKIPSINKVQTSSPEAKVIEAFIESKKDIRSELTSAIVKSKNWELLEVKKQELNLEDIFLQLTTEE